jgi:hypothetical protein
MRQLVRVCGAVILAGVSFAGCSGGDSSESLDAGVPKNIDYSKDYSPPADKGAKVGPMTDEQRKAGSRPTLPGMPGGAGAMPGMPGAAPRK